MQEKFARISLADIFSILNATFGFFGICMVSNSLTLAVKFVMISVLMDGIDGFVARKTGCSDLGKELDSLADVVSFGVLPSLILFKTDMLYASVPYLLACVYRLARFNVVECEDFIGLPSTASALCIASSILMGLPHIWVFALALSFLMVSTVRYIKIRNVALLGLAGATIILCLFFDVFASAVFTLTLIYILSPLISWCVKPVSKLV